MCLWPHPLFPPQVFWHSSAHVLGEALECQYGCKLCIGPPTQEGFYYDAYMGNVSITEKDYPKIKKKAEEICQKSNSQPFERIVLTKPQALELFADNPFKVALITAKIPDGGMTTAYRCGPLIDLCMGPHVPGKFSGPFLSSMRTRICCQCILFGCHDDANRS